MESIMMKELRATIKEIELLLPRVKDFKPNRQIIGTIIGQDLKRLLSDLSEWMNKQNEYLDWQACSYEIASILFCMGFPRQIWINLFKILSLEIENAQSSCDFLPLAILSEREINCDSINWMKLQIEEESIEIKMLFYLVCNQESSKFFINSEDYYCNQLANAVNSISNRQFEFASRSILNASQYWRDEDNNWDEYERGFYPQFDPALCALAFLYGEKGGKFDNWPAEDIRFLLPGLQPFLRGN